MKISIIIPNYNGLEYLEVCLESLSKQTFKDFEVIVVDNGSYDGSCEYVKGNHPYVKIIELDHNCGFSRAVNEGIKACKSDFIVLLNNDIEVDADWLSNLVKCIKNDDSIFSSSSKMIRYYDRSKLDDIGDDYNILGWAYKRGDGFPISKYNKIDKIFSSCAGAAIYRKDILDEIGYFDENFFAYLEDVDIGYRAKIHGYKNMFCSDAVVYHIGSATSGSKYNSFKVKLSARNNIYLIYKNMPILQIILNLPFLLIGSGIKYLFFRRLGLGKDYMEGVREGFRNLGELEKTEFKFKNLPNYVRIEIEMIVNTIKYIYTKIIG